MTDIPAEKTLYVFIDESGNFDFSSKGTKYFMLTAFATFDPVTHREQMVRLRYKLLAEGNDQDFFHASEDRQVVRDEMFQLLANINHTYEVHTVVAQKNKAHPSLYSETYLKGEKVISRITGMGLYRKLCECLLQYLFRGKAGHVDKIVVILGSLYQGEKKKVILKTLKHYLKTHFNGVAFDIYSHQTCVDLNCQLADYCCWALSVKWERGEIRPFEVIKPNIKSVFDYFRTGTTEFYEY